MENSNKTSYHEDGLVKITFGLLNEKIYSLISGGKEYNIHPLKVPMTDSPRKLASVSTIIKKRLSGSEDALFQFRDNGFYTGDTCIQKGNDKGMREVIIDLDSELLLRGIYGFKHASSDIDGPPKNFAKRFDEFQIIGGTKGLGTEGLYNEHYKVLRDGNLRLEELDFGFHKWQDLKRNNPDAYFTHEEINAAEGKGFIKKDGVWIPENKTVGKVWDVLNRGESNLSDYIKLNTEENPYDDRPLKVYFNMTFQSLNPWYLSNFRFDSKVDSNCCLINNVGYVAGIAEKNNSGQK